MLAKLADPRLTGMTAVQLEQLAAALAPVQAARAQQRYSQQRAGRARRAIGNVRARPLFDDAARLLLTLSLPPEQQAARRQVDSSRLHYHRNLLTRVPKSAQP
jgi:hypothetical protein